MWKKTIWIALGIILLGAGAAISQSVEPIRYDTPIVRIKDVARVQGVRDNQIYGLGLVVGLQGTGDGSG
ncbi:MAG TPA: flagellar biosynthesis protein FlgA, partial [Firmicutes bacterium]|nr:flagellar biosynthesis protein FlgA [Bacillota bacterium]